MKCLAIRAKLAFYHELPGYVYLGEAVDIFGTVPTPSTQCTHRIED